MPSSTYVGRGASNATVTVNATDGRVVDFALHGESRPDDHAWSSDFKQHKCDDTISGFEINITTSHGILFLTALLGAADLDEVQGTNLDYLYMGTALFQSFAGNDVSFATGGYTFQSPGEKLAGDLDGPANKSSRPSKTFRLDPSTRVRPGWFNDKNGTMRWGIEVVGGEPEVTTLLNGDNTAQLRKDNPIGVIGTTSSSASRQRPEDASSARSVESQSGVSPLCKPGQIRHRGRTAGQQGVEADESRSLMPFGDWDV
ncbi:hypothetical protein F5B21DRAFT_498436 [Xylaria acuta]|nr:hypothetical protein F5B21DRAFT_498436 [Xylaria acuta]